MVDPASYTSSDPRLIKPEHIFAHKSLLEISRED